MPIITYIEPNGVVRETELEVGKSVMQGAVENMVDGMLAECGGCCSCATCHCYVVEAWQEKLEQPSETELAMLDCVEERRPNSRLGCQITVAADHDGLTIEMPVSPY
jgi:2Fe-2S ferredoxin